MVRVHPLHFWHPAVPRAFHGYRIAQISDVHLDHTRASVTRLERAVDLVMGQQADVIVLTGDYLTLLDPGSPETLTRAVRRLNAPDGVLFVLGNHDHRRNRALAQQALIAAGAIDLNNRHLTLTRGTDCLHIAGVDSISRQRARLDLALAGMPAHGMAILLAHEPDFADVAASVGRFTLQLSGHTHGGQIRLPLLTETQLPAYGRRYVEGITLVRELWLSISRGVGMTGVPLRLFAPADVTVITLGVLHLHDG